MRAFFPAHFEDLQRLEGATVWMKNGYTMPYYPYAGEHVEFGRRVGLIPAAQQLEVKKIVTAAARSLRCSRCRGARACLPRRLGPWRAIGRLTTPICCSSTTTRTASTTTGPKMCGRPSTRTR